MRPAPSLAMTINACMFMSAPPLGLLLSVSRQHLITGHLRRRVGRPPKGLAALTA